jgi:hypothetical protein
VRQVMALVDGVVALSQASLAKSRIVLSCKVAH